MLCIGTILEQMLFATPEKTDDTIENQTKKHSQIIIIGGNIYAC